jgi:hypothetical protein
MKKIMNKLTMVLAIGLSLMGTAACSDPDEAMTSVEFNRLFSPTNIEAKVQNTTGVKVTWFAISAAEQYQIEMYADDANMTFSGTPAYQKTVQLTEDEKIARAECSWKLEPGTLEGETTYSVRVKAIGKNMESKWAATTFETGTEQIFNNVPTSDITKTSITLTWPAGVAVTRIDVQKSGEVIKTHTLTADEIAAGSVTIDGLTDDTNYKAVMIRGEKTRGTMTFTTPLNLNGATKVEAGTDLAAAITAAADGDVLALMPGEYTIAADGDATYKYGSLAINKNLTLRSARSSDRAIIRGRIQISAGASLDLNQIVLDGKDTSGDQAISYAEDGNYDHLNIQDCEVSNFVKGFYYVNKAAKINDITINNCLIHDIECSGGDMFDCRAGAILKLNITNSTVYHCALERDFVRYDDKSSNFEGVQPQITIDHCTLNDVSNLAGKRILYVRFAGNSITFTNNIVSNTAANFSNQNSTAIPTFQDNNNYWNAPALNAEGGAGKFIDTAGRALDPGYANAAEGDFTVGNEDVKFYGIGDPRWIK